MPTPEYQILAEQPLAATPAAANLPVVDEANASPEVARLYQHFRESFGRPQVPWILQCFATHPPLLEHMMGLAQSMLFVDGALGRLQKEMIATAVSAKNNCSYCADSHGFFFRVHGASPEMLSAALVCDTQSPSLTAAQQALLVFAQKVNDDAASIMPTDMESLRAVGWNDLQIAETIHFTALFACFNRVVNAFGLPSQNLLTMNNERGSE